MPLFPLFINIKQHKILVVGAGNVAARKIEKLLLFEASIQIVAPRIASEIQGWINSQKYSLAYEARVFDDSDLNGVDFVVVAADDIDLQKRIFSLCNEKKIPINCVDSPDYCSFIFPALIVEGDITIAINTSGKAPGLSRYLRQKIESFLPKNLSAIAEEMSRFRQLQKTKNLSFKERAEQFEIFAKSLLDGKFAPLGSPQTKKDQD